MTARPLDGVTVLDLTRILAGPFATMKMADLGATVWKVEVPGRGDDTRGWGPPFEGGWSCYFSSVNRGKKSIAIDLKNEKGTALLESLVARADVLIENFRPGTLEKLGFSWERLQALNPRLVYASVSGYGHASNKAKKAAYDVIIQGESGVQEITGEPDGAPIKSGISIADVVAGLLAVEGVLLALLARERTGRGDRVDVALYDGLLSLLTYQGQNWLGAGKVPERLGNQHPSIVPYQAFATSDGWVNVGVGSESLWRSFCGVVDRPDLLDDPRYATNKDRVEHRAELQAEVAAAFASRTSKEWCDRLDAAGIPAGIIQGVPAALAAAEADERAMVVEVPGASADGAGEHRFRFVGNPVRLGSVTEGPGFAYGSPPRLGEHTDEILQTAAGLGDDAVAALRAEGVVS